uniref:DUF5597 domain-containing protein n=1 Tax=Angiostrongylus cantonensis TaxID=6313 RepID=A0A0K0DIZ3_ANGCA
MKAAWIKNYGDDLYLQCTYTCIRILDRRFAHASIRHDVIGLAETRRRHSFNAVCDTGEELFLGACDSRGVDDVGFLVNTSSFMNVESFEQLKIRIGRLQLKRCGSIPASTIFVVFA